MGIIANKARTVRGKLVGRAYWLYKYSYKWHMDDLVARGLVVGKNVTIMPSAHIDYRFPYLISIGDNCVLSGGVCLFAHDSGVSNFIDGCLRLGKVEIREDCFFGQNCLVLPGVTIGPNVLVAAGSVVDRDVPPNSCVVGVPARIYAKFDDLLERHKKQLVGRSVFRFDDIRWSPDRQLIENVRNAVRDGDAYAQGYVPKHPHLVNGDLSRRSAIE